MRNVSTLPLILLAIGLSSSLLGQSRPAQAPARIKPASKPASTLKAPEQERKNVEKLPFTPQQAPPPPPAATQAAAPTRRRAPVRRPTRSYSGDFGFERGDKLLTVGVGLSSYYYGTPIGAAYEYGIDQDFSVGAQFDYNSGKSDYNSYYNIGLGYTATYFGARGSYHVNRVLNLNSPNVDLYVGLGLGYRSFKWKDSGYSSYYDYNSGLFFNYFIGGKYYFNNNIGAMIELGYTGISSSRVGLAFKF